METEESVCSNCLGEFKAKPKGFLRYSLSSRLGNVGISIREGLGSLLPRSTFSTPDVKRKDPRFLCHECHSLLLKAITGKHAETEFFRRTKTPSYVQEKLKRRNPFTPSKDVGQQVTKRSKVDVATSPFVKPPGGETKSPRKIRSWKNKARLLLNASKYKSLFLLLHSQSSTAAKEFEEVLQILVRREVTGFRLGQRKLNQPVTLNNIHNFDWSVFLQEFSQHLPLLFRTVCTASSSEKVAEILDRSTSRAGIGNLIATALFLRNRKYKFIPALHAVSIWRSGGSHKVLESFNKLGLCLGVTATRNTVDRLRESYDSMILEWRTQIETSLKDGQDEGSENVEELVQAAETESSVSEESDECRGGEITKERDKTPASRSLQFHEDVHKASLGKEEHAVLPGYTFCWDNVQIDTVARHQTKEKRSKVLLWALTFAVENRIHTYDLENSGQQLTNARKIPLQAYLPDSDDLAQLRDRMTIVVARILCQNFTYFEDGLDTVVPLHIEHQYSAQTKKKSNIVNLGVIETNPSSTEGAVQIMQNLEKYIPHHPDNAPFKTVCFGDGLSVERVVDAKRSRATGLNAWDRFETFEPSPQEFHKRLLLMQDTMDDLFSGRSAADRGTLFHVKNVFNKRSVKKSVKDAFNHDSDFLRLVTEGYVCLFAKALVDCSLDGKEGPYNEPEKWTFLKDLAEEIVRKVWSVIPEENLRDVLTAPVLSDDEDDDEEEDEESKYNFCCQEDTEEEVIECSNPNCPRGQWFHLSCAGITDIPDGDWWCSKECRGTQRSIFCVCKKLRPDLQMKRCSREEKCPRGEWFHRTCVKLDIGSSEVSTWFCSVVCRKAAEAGSPKDDSQDDHIYNYSCAVIWRGLNDLVRRDAVREGDGAAMLSHWKIDMPTFWNKNHYKYLILGHRLLAGQNGWLPARLAEDMKWNRTANLQGHEGSNLEMDLVNEFLNNDFKENLKHARGMYTPTHVARTAQIVGTLGHSIEKAYHKGVISSYIHSAASTSKKQKQSLKSEVCDFIKEYEGDRLVERIPGREHSAFPGFQSNPEVQNPPELKKRLLKYSKKLQKQRDIRPRL